MSQIAVAWLLTRPAVASVLPPYPYGMIEEYCDVGYWRDLGTAEVTG